MKSISSFLEELTNPEAKKLVSDLQKYRKKMTAEYKKLKFIKHQFVVGADYKGLSFLYRVYKVEVGEDKYGETEVYLEGWIDLDWTAPTDEELAQEFEDLDQQEVYLIKRMINSSDNMFDEVYKANQDHIKNVAIKWYKKNKDHIGV